MFRVGIYARVSTQDQDPGLQLSELRKYVQDRGWQVYKEYTDIGHSGAKDSRPELNRLMKDAKRRRFDTVLVWKFDRFARSVKHLVNSLYEFKALGIDFVSLTEGIDTSTPLGEAMFSIIGAMAQLERDLIRERVTAGMKRAREKGKALGRPTKEIDPGEFATLREKGLNMEEIAETLGVSRATLFNRNGSLKKVSGNGHLHPLISQGL
ncbi:MAG TPA: recombinase family protein [Candidatus Avalokitesvara rifleensis]|uniref:recombinase family protein n=1 Tax=Candidatus Avalokitesvara rifleensis TaxID=3367620 RepID=UPI002713F836|nr:recombinase family protein [Candidatus Brocadiales bacterium]